MHRAGWVVGPCWWDAEVKDAWASLGNVEGCMKVWKILPMTYLSTLLPGFAPLVLLT